MNYGLIVGQESAPAEHLVEVWRYMDDADARVGSGMQPLDRLSSYLLLSRVGFAVIGRRGLQGRFAVALVTCHGRLSVGLLYGRHGTPYDLASHGG